MASTVVQPVSILGNTSMALACTFHRNKFSYEPMHKSIVDSAALAIDLNEAVYGVKSLSLLSSEIDLVKGIPVDYMHAVLEGTTKWLLHAWFDSKNNREAFYLGRYLKAIDQFTESETST